jgi:hypothetical protein
MNDPDVGALLDDDAPPTPEAVRFQLVALDRDGQEVDRIDYEDPWSSGRS